MKPCWDLSCLSLACQDEGFETENIRFFLKPPSFSSHSALNAVGIVWLNNLWIDPVVQRNVRYDIMEPKSRYTLTVWGKFAHVFLWVYLSTGAVVDPQDGLYPIPEHCDDIHLERLSDAMFCLRNIRILTKIWTGHTRIQVWSLTKELNMLDRNK
jgi:hypothetical protein